MSNAQYKLYVDDVLLLARSIVLKSESTANSINQHFIETGSSIVIDGLPETWKYYLNLSGEYHETDTMMYVTSLDTREQIAFTKDNLLIHRATGRGYGYGSRFYKELVSKHPSQVDLIQGILNPIDIQFAIDAVDGQILNYDNRLVEGNETNLLSELQKRIDGWKVRWDIKDYAKIDDLYPAANLGILYMNIPLFILNIRMANCRTEKVHSFHIRQYLASNGKLESYIDMLNKKQMLFLYRNIKYINKNAGKSDTFTWLVEALMTERLLPLAKYRLQHNISEMPEKLLPNVEGVRIDLTSHTSGNVRSIYSPNELIHKEVRATKNNHIYQAEALQDLQHRYPRHLRNALPTKMLESSVIDRSESFTLKFTDVLLNHWISWACEGNYLAMANFDNPANGESLWFTAKEAFILYLYAYNASHGIIMKNIPDVKAIFVRKPEVPSFEKLRSLATPDRVPDHWIRHLRENQTVIDDIVSTATFYEKCQNIHQDWRLATDFIAHREHMTVRGQTENVALHLYEHKKYNLGDLGSYEDWLQARNLELNNLSAEEFDLLANTLMAVSTGANLKVSVGLSELHESMVRLLRQLSSYSIQIVTELQGSNITILGCPIIRVGDYSGKGIGYTRLHQNNIYTQIMSGKSRHDYELDISNATFDTNVTSKEYHDSHWDHTVGIKESVFHSSTVRVVLPTIYATLTTRMLDPVEDTFPIKSVEDYRYPDTPPEDLDI